MEHKYVAVDKKGEIAFLILDRPQVICLAKNS